MTREEAIKAFEEIRANAQNHLGKKYAAASITENSTSKEASSSM